MKKKMLRLAALMLAVVMLSASALAETITLPASTVVIGDEAFAGDTSISKVIVPEGVEEIGERAFAGSSLEEIELPASLVTIPDDMLEGCEDVTVVVPSGSKAHAWAVRNGYIEGKAILESDHPYAPNTDQTWTYTHPTDAYALAVTFSEDTYMIEYDRLYLMDAEGTEKEYSYGQLAGETIVLMGDFFTVRLVSDNDELEDYGFSIIAIEAFATEEELQNHGRFTTEMLPDGTLSIVAYEGLAIDVVIPETIGGAAVTEIGDGAFTYNNNLVSVTLHDGIRKLGGAFYSCENLRSVNLPDSIKSIGTFCFYGCESLTSITLPSGLTEIPDGLFSQCRGIGNVTIPAGVKRIGEYAFCSCISMTEINIPAGVMEIGEGAFSANGSYDPEYLNGKLQKFTVASGNTAYKTVDGSLVDAKTNELIRYPYGRATTSYTIPAGIASIGDYAFENCWALESLNVPGSVKTVRSLAFCPALKTVVLEEGVEVLGEIGACDNLTSLTLPASLKKIGSLPIVYDEDWNEYYVVTVTAPEGSYAQEWCFLNGVPLAAEVGKVVSGDFTFAKLGSKLILQSYSGSAAEVTIPASVNGSVVNVIGPSVFEYSETLESVVIPEGVTTIGERAFNDCENLTSLDLPDSLLEVGMMGFSGCSSLETLELPGNLEIIGPLAFWGIGVEEITIPASVTEIGEYDEGAFSDCENLTTVVFEGGNTPIGEAMFSDCPNLSSVTLAEGLEEITWSAFSRCVSLKRIELPSTLKKINGGAFRGSGLNSIVLPEGLQEIDYGAFESCTYLRRVYIPESAEIYDDGSSVFDGSHADFTIYGVAGSSAEEYAAQYDHPFVVGKMPEFSESELLGLPESQHPYPNNTDLSWEYTHPTDDCKVLIVWFSAKTEFEHGKDFLYVTDGQGNETVYTGTQLSDNAVWVYGHSFTLRLITDGSGQAYGFKVTKIDEGW